MKLSSTAQQSYDQARGVTGSVSPFDHRLPSPGDAKNTVARLPAARELMADDAHLQYQTSTADLKTAS